MLVSEYNDFILAIESLEVGANATVEIVNSGNVYNGKVKEIVPIIEGIKVSATCELLMGSYSFDGEFIGKLGCYAVGIDINADEQEKLDKEDF